VPAAQRRAQYEEESDMKNLKRAAALTVLAGGIVAAGAGAASAHDAGDHCRPAPSHAPHAQATGSAVQSPGVGSGNVVQIPVDIPVNVTGNTVNVIGLLNPAFGDHSANF
jgi:hypothetical protein